MPELNSHQFPKSSNAIDIRALTSKISEAHSALLEHIGNSDPKSEAAVNKSVLTMYGYEGSLEAVNNGTPREWYQGAFDALVKHAKKLHSISNKLGDETDYHRGATQALLDHVKGL